MSTHYYEVDTPLNNDNGSVLANFTRLETFGARNDHWVAVTVDPGEPDLFVIKPRVVAANANQ